MIPGDWQGIHVFYAGNRRPMLIDCIGPLVDSLRRDRLLAGYFFINYWLEGPHLRLRLRPSTVDATDEVRSRAEDAIGGFVRERPALYAVSPALYSTNFDHMFGLEFSPEERLQYLDEHGVMCIEPNNSYKYVPYEPEYGKYGGAAGVALAEWHFEHSSDLVIEATRTLNLHLRSIGLGSAAQLMMVMTAVFLGEEQAMVDFLNLYARYWRSTFDGVVPMETSAAHDKAYETMGNRVTRRFLDLRAACVEARAEDLPGQLGRWYEHSVELRDRVVELAVQGELSLRGWDGRHLPVTDPAVALRQVLAPYLHMTNNRLNMSLADEAYLGHVLARALGERHLVEVER